MSQKPRNHIFGVVNFHFALTSQFIMYYVSLGDRLASLQARAYVSLPGVHAVIMNNGSLSGDSLASFS